MRYIIAALIGKTAMLLMLPDHYSNGKPQMTGGYSSFEPEVREGEFVFYYDNGSVKSREHFKTAKRTGLYQYYYRNGRISVESSYLDANLKVSTALMIV